MWLGNDPPFVTLRNADGWNVASSDPAEFRVLATKADEVASEVGRSELLPKAVQVFADAIDLKHARDLLRQMTEAGADTVTFVLHRERGPDKVRRLADSIF